MIPTWLRFVWEGEFGAGLLWCATPQGDLGGTSVRSKSGALVGSFGVSPLNSNVIARIISCKQNINNNLKRNELVGERVCARVIWARQKVRFNDVRHIWFPCESPSEMAREARGGGL
jgi:hypothetical protein